MLKGLKSVNWSCILLKQGLYTDKDRTKEEELKEFDFLGYTFKAVYIKCKDGVMRNNFIASVSKTAAKGLKDKIKALEIHKRTGRKIDMIAELLNLMIRG